jgi:hypothetical protein
VGRNSFEMVEKNRRNWFAGVWGTILHMQIKLKSPQKEYEAVMFVDEGAFEQQYKSFCRSRSDNYWNR